MTTPLQDYQTARAQRAADRKLDDVHHWEQWKAAPEEHKPEKLKPLLEAYAPTFRQKINAWKPPAIPEAAFKAELTKHFITALGDYNPERAALSTHVDMRLKKALRTVGKHQNVAYIPEGQTQHIGKIQRAQDLLKEELGRDATADEIGDHLGMPPKKVTTILTSMRKDMPSSLWESDPVAPAASREAEVLNLLRPELTLPHQQTVFDHIFGLNGAPKIEETSRLAKKIGLNQSQVSRLKSGIIKQYNLYK